MPSDGTSAMARIVFSFDIMDIRIKALEVLTVTRRCNLVVGFFSLLAMIVAPSIVAAQTPGAAAGAPLAAPTPDITQSSEQVLQALGVLAQSTANEAEHYAGKAYSGAKSAVTDSTVTTEAKAALLENRVTNSAATAIHVDTRQGVVTLSGKVDSAATATSAQGIVAQLVGVTQVVNNLRYPASKGAPMAGAGSSGNAAATN